MNVSQLPPPPQSQVQRISKQSEEKDADFLALRMLNKRARVRLSPQPLQLQALPGRGILFAVSNSLGCFAAATLNNSGQHTIAVSSLSELRSAFESSSSNTEIPFKPRRTIPLPGTPNIIVFASNDSRLLVGLSQGPIVVFDSHMLAAEGTDIVAPLHTFSSPTNTAPREILANPGDMPELVAVLYELDGSANKEFVQILDVQKLQAVGGWTSGGTPETTPTALSWSPKGKQIAIANQSGDIVTFSPSSTSAIKSFVPRPPSVSAHMALSTTWLSNPDFHVIYVPQGPVTAETEQTHVIISLDPKANTALDVKMNTPYMPFPGLRPPGPFTVVFRGWEPSKFLLFIGDSTSSDIGLIGCTPDPAAPNQEAWVNYSLEETSTPTVPLDADMNETVLLGLVLDLTNTQPFTHKTASGEDLALPPPPIMYAFASDGTVTGWHVLNTKGIPYPGMVKPSAVTIARADSTTMLESPLDATVRQSTFAQPSTFGQPNGAATGFGQSSATSAFGQPSAPSGFGQPSFGQPAPVSAFQSTTSGFGQPSGFGTGGAFGATSPGTSSTFGAVTTPTTGGFGAFAATGTAKFGQSTFGFGGTTAPAPAPAPAPMTVAMSTSEDTMATEPENEPDTGLGGLSLGGAGSAEPKPGFGTTGMFGALSAPQGGAQANQAGSGFGGVSGPIKPASGFGAFANQGPSAFGSTSAFGGVTSPPAADTTKAAAPSSAFGTSGFAAAKPATTSAFGQPSFGQPSFGQPGFGQPGFGATGFGAAKPAFGAPSTGATSGGFGAFAQGTSSAFGSALSTPSAPAGKSAWGTAGAEATKENEPPKPADATTEPPAALKAPSPAPAPAVSPPAEAGAAAAAASPFKSSAPASGAGAFGSLSTSSIGFGKGKLEAGFGAFGAGTGTSSPFFNPPKAAPVSAFGTTPSPPKPEAGASKPTFGAPSALGGATSVFAKPSGANGAKPAFGAPSPLGAAVSAFGTSTTPTKPPPSTTSNAFSAFSGTAVGFGAVAGKGPKSFGDLLRQDTDAAREAAKEPSKIPISVFSRPPAGAPATRAPEPSALVLSARDRRGVVEEVEEGEEEEAEAPGSPHESEQEEDHEREVAESGDEYHEDGEDDASSFLSESFSEGSVPEERASEEEPVSPELSPAVARLALPETPRVTAKPPSTTPKGTPPSLKVTEPSPPLTPEPSEKAEPAAETVSTTPPGSPAKEPSPPPPQPSKTPPALQPAASPFTLGIGRPSTRPARSSPLASAPISRTDEEEAEISPSKPGLAVDTLKGLPPLPKPAFGPAASPSPSPKEEKPPAESVDKASRPKTPPLLSVLAAPAPKPPPFTLFAPPTPKVNEQPLTLFGQKPASPPAAPNEKPSSPSIPKPTFQPPPSGFFGKPPPTVPSFAGATESPPFSPSPPSSVSGVQPPAPSPATITSSRKTPETPVSIFSPPPAGFFGQKTAIPPSTPPTSGFLGQPAKVALPPLPAGGLFGQKAPSAAGEPAASPGGLFGAKPVVAPVPVPAFATPAFPPAPSLFGKPAPPPAPAVPKPQELEKGMQEECAHLFLTLTKELEMLKAQAQQASRMRVELYKPSGGLRTQADLADSGRWGVGDVGEYQRVMLSVRKDIADLGELKITLVKAIRELESGILKATTKKEEIVRFDEASTNAEFAKMLKARTLGPEHLEMQTQLRRSIRVIQDRIQKLEDHLQASKKKLNQMKTGRPSIRPPSLDTINRTYRNIDVAAAQQADEIARLSSRVSKLNLTAARSTPTFPARERRVPADSRLAQGEKGNRRALNVTPNVAVTTAAALNAERGAQKLKRALLKVRKEPLLNTQAAEAPSAPTDFKTPQKPQIKAEPSTPAALNFGSLSWNNASPSPGETPQTPQWNLSSFEPLDHENSPSPQGVGRQRGSTSKLHQKPVQFKKPSGAPNSTPPPPTGFSWGPLPGVTPMKMLSADVRKKEENDTASPTASLSNSWVADDFGSKN